MMPVGPLMIEHRLIERVIKIIGDEAGSIEKTGTADEARIDAMIDFICMYADRCHHGKEEDILFTALNKKPLNENDKRVMIELVEEHKSARSMTKTLITAKNRYAQGETAAAKDIASVMKELAVFYPVHIAKEDKRFFIPCMEYFSPAEQDQMLKEFYEFDRLLIHEKYREVVEAIEAK
jgi:hemerythrin-like domain-containing protein